MTTETIEIKVGQARAIVEYCPETALYHERWEVVDPDRDDKVVGIYVIDNGDTREDAIDHAIHYATRKQEA